VDEIDKEPDNDSSKVLMLWECTNPECATVYELTETLSVEYSPYEIDSALCPRCGKYTLRKIRSIWRDELYEE